MQNTLQYPLTLGPTKSGGGGEWKGGGVMPSQFVQFRSDAIPARTLHTRSGLVLFQFALFLNFSVYIMYIPRWPIHDGG